MVQLTFRALRFSRSAVTLLSILSISSVMSKPKPVAEADAIARTGARMISAGTSTNEITRSTSTGTNYSDDKTVTLYTDTDFRGFSTIMHLSNACVNLSGPLNDEASSIDAHGGCVVLCEHSQCRGKCERVDYYSSNLSHLGLNDAASSIKSCDS